MNTESQWTSRPKGFLAHFCFICTLVFFKATCVCFCTCMWLDSWQQASDVCVYPHVCLLVLNPPLQSDSPLSGIKKGGGWLVGLVVGCCFSSTLKLSERMELDWTFLNGTLCRDTAELGQVLKGPGKTIQEYIQYLQITNAYLFWFSKMKRLSGATWGNDQGKHNWQEDNITLSFVWSSKFEVFLEAVGDRTWQVSSSAFVWRKKCKKLTTGNGPWWSGTFEILCLIVFGFSGSPVGQRGETVLDQGSYIVQGCFFVLL